MAEGKTGKKTTWVFDLDTQKFKEKLKDGGKKLKEFSDKGGESLDKFKVNFGKLAGAAVALIAIFKTLQIGLDLAFRADKLKEINSQFDILTRRVGIAGDELKTQLDEAARGLLTTNELLEITNKSMLSMGATAAKAMPEIVSLADKIASSMGGDITERIAQFTAAVEGGSGAAFEQLGILVDEEKVLRDFAKTMGVTVDTLNQAGRRQAFLNAALAKGKEQFSAVDSSVSKNIDAWSRFQSAITKVIDTIATKFENEFGPVITGVFNNLADWLEYFATDADKGLTEHEKKMRDLVNTSRELGVELLTLEQRYENEAKLGLFAAGTAQAKTRTELKGIKQRIEENQKLLETQRELVKENKKTPKKPRPDGTGAGGADLTKVAAQRSAFEKEILGLKKSRVAQEIALNMTLEDADRLHNEQRALIQNEFQVKLDDLQAKADQGLILKEQQAQLEVELMSARTNALIEQDRNLAAVREQSLNNWVEHSASAAEGFAASMTAASHKAAKEQKNFGKQAGFALNAFQSHASSAFLALGEGSKNLGEAMKGFVLGALADIAENHGKLYMLQGFTNPALFGAGAALMVLAGFLRSQAGAGGAAGGGGGASGGGGGTGAIGGGETPEVTPEVEAPEKKKVEINFHGDYLDTAETQQRFVDIIREAGDVQEFQINKID